MVIIKIEFLLLIEVNFWSNFNLLFILFIFVLLKQKILFKNKISFCKLKLLKYKIIFYYIKDLFKKLLYKKYKILH